MKHWYSKLNMSALNHVLNKSNLRMNRFSGKTILRDLHFLAYHRGKDLKSLYHTQHTVIDINLKELKLWTFYRVIIRRIPGKIKRNVTI
jgi:hypothetical protein